MSIFRSALKLIVLCLLMPALLPAQKQEWTDEEKAFFQSVNKPIVYTLPGMDDVKVMKDLDYKETDNPNLKMDVYLPPGLNPSDRVPAVILVAGGTAKDGLYQSKNWGSYQGRARLLAASGLIAVNFTHRLGFPDLAIAEGAQDLEALVNHLRANAEKYNIDKDGLAIVTYSGGGPLLSYGMMGKTPFIKCLVGMYSILDVQENEFAIKSVAKDIREQYSPINYIKENANLPPILLVRAGRDSIPNLNKIQDNFIARALAANVTIDVMNHPEGTHGFDNKEPHPRTSEIMKGVIEYLNEHLNR